MHLYKTRRGAVAVRDGRSVLIPTPHWDEIFNFDNLGEMLQRRVEDLPVLSGFDPDTAADLLPPIGSQEVWGAGVTYYRSREARMEESKDAGGGDFYSRVYSAERPEIFFKTTAHRVTGHRHGVRARRDSKWTCPEPEWTLAVNARGRIVGYTIANDVTARDIEGENPLYLPQSKTYNQSCSLGPGILIAEGPMGPETAIRLEILRAGKQVFDGATQLSQMKRDPESLVEYLSRDNGFPMGAFLMTGTGIVPPDGYSMEAGDEIRISIAGIGTLVNSVL